MLFRSNKVFNCKKQIIEVVNLLIKTGSIGKNEELKYMFPKKRGILYYGAAHGTFGVVYILLKAAELIEEVPKIDNLMNLLKNTCKKMISLQFSSGNFPVSEGFKEDTLIHFCHGAPGLIPVILAAHNAFKDDMFLTAALSAGEIVWTDGILLKGNSLCHGINGNAYFLHSLYRYTKDLKWKHRFTCFVDATWNAKYQELVKAHKDPSRFVKGISDTPYSLMEGMGGTIVLYADILGNDLMFPGYEL